MIQVTNPKGRYKGDLAEGVALLNAHGRASRATLARWRKGLLGKGWASLSGAGGSKENQEMCEWRAGRSHTVARIFSKNLNTVADIFSIKFQEKL